MRILLCAAVLASFGTAFAQTPSSTVQKSSPARTAPLAPKPSVIDPQIAAKRKELADIDAQLDRLKNKKDSLSELGEDRQLRTQALMERRSKVAQQISELMKKSSDTQSSITSNLK
jgi:hypothetical protein